MSADPHFLKRKPATAMIRDRLNFVLTTTPLTSRKDSSNDFVQRQLTRVQR